MISPQPPLESSESPDYGGQLDRESLKTATLSGARWIGVSRIVAEVLGLATTVVLARLVSPAEYGTAVIVLILPMLATILTFEGFGAFLVPDPLLYPRARRLGGPALDHERLAADGLVFFLSPLVAEPVFGPARATGPAVRADLPDRQLRKRAARAAAAAAGLEVDEPDRDHPADRRVRRQCRIGVCRPGQRGADPRRDHRRRRRDGRAAGRGVRRPATLGLASARSIVKFGAPAAVAGLSATLQRNVTFLVLGGRVSPAQVGLYWRAYQLGVEYQAKISDITYRVAKPVLTRAERIEDLREIRTRLLRINTTLIFPLLALLIVLAPDVVPWIFGPDWTGAVAPTQVLAVAGLWTILLTGIDAPLMAVGRPGALAIFNIAMVVATGVTAWFTAPMGITAVAVGMAICQLVLLLAGQFFLLRPLVGVPMRESLGDSAAALACSGVLLLATLPVAELCARRSSRCRSRC